MDDLKPTTESSNGSAPAEEQGAPVAAEAPAPAEEQAGAQDKQREQTSPEPEATAGEQPAVSPRTPAVTPQPPPLVSPPRLVWPPVRRPKPERNGAPAAAAAPPAPPQPARGVVVPLRQERQEQQEQVVPHEVQRPSNQSETTWNKEPVIELVEVHKSFGSLKVLDGVTCRIPKGEITVLMGPSGTGKSVTLRHIVGLLPPDRGDIYVDGKPVHKLNERELLDLRRGIGMLFQDGALFSSMTLYDNVAFPLRQHTKKSEDEVREIVMEHLMEVGLAGADKRMPNELSGGMRKRAGFARALVMEPKIL
ncbi:MAG TPA: ATP-binding cassette domain-containing protein, partial [Dehalococcoidia bacterium]|nr:ATP-binding cassette domain-containing protein [Dehalococcoidia bacterium]